jgi:hypothetical protein
MDVSKIKEIITMYKATGKVAFYYPRLKKIALNGGRMILECEAVKLMLKTINIKE